jgi:hypothetical protein
VEFEILEVDLFEHAAIIAYASFGCSSHPTLSPDTPIGPAPAGESAVRGPPSPASGGGLGCPAGNSPLRDPELALMVIRRG